MDFLLTSLNRVHPLSNELVSYLKEHLYAEPVAKGAYLLKSGQVCNNIYFIEKGLVRSFYEKDDKEINAWFFAEGDVVISVQSFYTRQKSHENIQALEDSLVYYISYDQLQYIYAHFAEFNFVGRVLTEKYYALSEERLFVMRKQTAADRYKYLRDNNPQLIQRVASKMIASYLGINEETLSRIKKHH